MLISVEMQHLFVPIISFKFNALSCFSVNRKGKQLPFLYCGKIPALFIFPRKEIPDILHTLFKLKHRGKLVFAFIYAKAAAGKSAYFSVPVFKLNFIWLCALNYGIAFIALQRKINNLVFRIVVISSFGRFGAHFHAFKVADIKTGIISSCYCFSIPGFRGNKPKLYFFFGKRFFVKGNKMRAC